MAASVHTPLTLTPRVFDVLRASLAQLERASGLGDGLLLAQWRNRDDATTYVKPGHHTISVYLAGGFGTHLAERPNECGAPGRVCILPSEHESHWIVEGDLRFLHLYVSAEAWADRVVRLLDAEPRAITLDERIFGEDPALAAWAAQLARQDWDSPDARLAAGESTHAALDGLVLAAARPAQRNTALRTRGGLSSSARRRVVEWIEAHLAEDFSLKDMADEAALSEFHFARMFRASMGVTPYAWVAQRRLRRAMELLQHGTLPLEQIAAATGFAHASHLSRRFRANFGYAPGLVRKMTNS